MGKSVTGGRLGFGSWRICSCRSHHGVAGLLLALFYLLTGSPALAQLSAEETQRLQAFQLVFFDAFVNDDADACESAMDATRELAMRDWTIDGYQWWGDAARCRALRRNERSGWFTRPAIDAWFAAQQAHFSNPPPAAPRFEFARLGTRIGHWGELRNAGFVAEADAAEWLDIEGLATAVAAADADGSAQRQLLWWGGILYGTRSRNDFLQRFHAHLGAKLGVAHVATLQLLRARIFADRLLGRPAQALALSDEYAALVATHHPDNKHLAIGIASERIGALEGVGRYADALDEALRVRAWLRLQAPLPDAGLMRVNYKLAALSLAMADHDAAVAYAEASLEHARAADPRVGAEARVADVFREQARLQRGDAGAEADLKGALERATVHEYPVGQPAYMLARRALETQNEALLGWARAYLERFIGLHRDASHGDRALPALLDAARADPGMPQALLVGSEALVRSFTGRDQPLLANAHFSLARHVAVRQPEAALWLYKRGANTLQQLRNRLPDGDSGLQRAWLADHEPALRAYIGLLIDRGRLTEAQQAIDVLRDEELHEFRRRSRGASPLRSASARVLSYTAAEQRRNLALQPVIDRVHFAAMEADRRADGQADWSTRTQAGDPRLNVEFDTAAGDLRHLLSQDEAKKGSSRDDAAKLPSARWLPAGTARLRYFVREATLDIVLERSGRQERAAVPVARSALNQAVQQLRAVLADARADPLPAAQAMHRLLIAPIGARLQGIDTLLVVPDAALRYVPFAALHDGRGYLAERTSVSIELAGGHSLQRSIADPADRRSAVSLAAFGRSQPDAVHAALPGVAEELATLRGLKGAKVASAANKGFTLAALRDSLAAKPAIVHLATHFVLDPAGEEQSYLLLGDGTRLSLTRLRELPWAGVQLALLSACDSAVAVDGAQGRELAGFASALQAAGVRNVLATLWRIDDGVTAQWMAGFYAPWRQVLPGRPLPDARRLAQTQRDWLIRHARTPLAHPHYWAGFTWMGRA